MVQQAFRLPMIHLFVFVCTLVKPVTRMEELNAQCFVKVPKLIKNRFS